MARRLHDSDPVLAPAARRLVKELGLDAAAIPGSGKDGRILKSDVTAYLDARDAAAAEAKEAAAVVPPETTATGAIEGERPEQRVPMTRLRARIAERLLEAQANAAILTTFNEVDLKAAMDLRARHKEAFEKAHDVRLGFMSFFVRAAVVALQKFPVVNASIENDEIVYHDYYDIGIAVSTERGLMVPIIRNAENLGLAELELENRQMADLSGGQKQRVAVARALVTNPTLVLADEPTANLDRSTALRIIELMRQLRDEFGTTFVFSTHDPKIMGEAEVTFELEDGRLHQGGEGVAA